MPNKSQERELILDLHFSTEQLEEMLTNAKAGGAVSIKVKLELSAEATLKEVVLR